MIHHQAQVTEAVFTISCNSDLFVYIVQSADKQVGTAVISGAALDVGAEGHLNKQCVRMLEGKHIDNEPDLRREKSQCGFGGTNYKLEFAVSGVRSRSGSPYTRSPLTPALVVITGLLAATEPLLIT
ncbi:hypothetical protein J6590_076945 [Homalodisca vitripennis]|nr:hypothetical protein J6590_076945 [Homalodisca vitripennis]